MDAAEAVVLELAVEDGELVGYRSSLWFVVGCARHAAGTGRRVEMQEIASQISRTDY